MHLYIQINAFVYPNKFIAVSKLMQKGTLFLADAAAGNLDIVICCSGKLAQMMREIKAILA